MQHAQSKLINAVCPTTAKFCMGAVGAVSAITHTDNAPKYFSGVHLPQQVCTIKNIVNRENQKGEIG